MNALVELCIWCQRVPPSTTLIHAVARDARGMAVGVDLPHRDAANGFIEPSDAGCAERVEELGQGSRTSAIGGNLPLEFVDDERRGEIEEVAEEVVGVNDVEVERRSSRLREVVDRGESRRPPPPLVRRRPRGFVFAATDGGRLDPDNFRSRAWMPAVAAAGLTPLRIHDLRHTTASLAIAAGGDVKTLQTMLGHASAVMTLDRYRHLMPGRGEDLANRLDAFTRSATTELIPAAGRLDAREFRRMEAESTFRKPRESRPESRRR